MAKERALERKPIFYKVKLWMREDKALSEKAILRLVQRGNREAYGEIVKLYMKTAYYIALGFVHNHQDALDLSQEAFVKAFRKIKNFDIERPFFPWFYQLMRNLCLDHLERGRRRREIPLEEIQASKQMSEEREVKEVLWKGITKLPLEQREVIILRYFRQYSYQEIAEIIGKPMGTVMSSLYYAKRKLKEIMKEYLNLEQ